MTQAPPSLSKRAPKTDTRLVSLIHRMLEKDPLRRPTMFMVARELADLGYRFANEQPPPRPRRFWLRIALGLVAVAAGTVAMISYWQRPRSVQPAPVARPAAPEPVWDLRPHEPTRDLAPPPGVSDQVRYDIEAAEACAQKGDYACAAEQYWKAYQKDKEFNHLMKICDAHVKGKNWNKAEEIANLARRRIEQNPERKKLHQRCQSAVDQIAPEEVQIFLPPPPPPQEQQH